MEFVGFNCPEGGRERGGYCGWCGSGCWRFFYVIQSRQNRTENGTMLSAWRRFVHILFYVRRKLYQAKLAMRHRDATPSPEHALSSPHSLPITLFLCFSPSIPFLQSFGCFVRLLCCRCVKEFGSRDALLYASVFPQNKVGWGGGIEERKNTAYA